MMKIANKWLKRNGRTNYLSLFRFVLVTLLIVGCKERKSFNKQDWNSRLEGIHYLRAPMINDLVENHLDSSLCYKEIVVLLGTPVKSESLKKMNHIFYEIEVKGGRGADDAWIKYLDIELNRDSCFQKAKIIKKQVSSY